MIVRGWLQLGAADSTFCQIASDCLHNEVTRTTVGDKKKKKEKCGIASFVIAETYAAPAQNEKLQEL